MAGSPVVATILVVEDSDTLRDLVEVMLFTQGYKVCSAANGKEALKVLGSTKVDLVITDLMMPVMSGFELISELQRLHRDAKIIVLSGAPAELDRVRSYGAYATLKKPVTHTQLLEMVRTVLG